jgi:chromosome segregation ATPase
MSSPTTADTVATPPAPPEADQWDSEDAFEARMKRIQSQAAKPVEAEKPAGETSPDLAALHAENGKLKTSVDEGRRRAMQLEAEIEKYQKRELDSEKMLEEKSEYVRKLEQELGVFKSKQSSGVTEEELLALHAELERERQHLEEDRGTMEQQFRQLEMNMSRERAEIARERNELQRTKTELKHKLEALEKGTHQDLSPLRRLRDEVAPPAAPMARPAPPTLPALQNLPALNRKAPESEDTKRSGIISRFLGKRE